MRTVLVSAIASLVTAFAVSWFAFHWMADRYDPFPGIVTVDLEQLLAAKKAEFARKILDNKEPLDQSEIEAEVDAFLLEIRDRLAGLPDNYIVLARQAVVAGKLPDITSQLAP